MRNHFQLQNYYFSTKFCAFNCIIFNAKRNLKVMLAKDYRSVVLLFPQCGNGSLATR